MGLQPKELKVVGDEPLNLDNYKLWASRIMVKIPMEALTSKKIAYKTTRVEGIFFEVVKIGTDMKEEHGVKVGDFVMFNPYLPINQIPVVEIKGYKLMVVEFHELFIIRDKDCHVDEEELGMQFLGMLNEA